jgi:hypothetical protein
MEQNYQSSRHDTLMTVNIAGTGVTRPRRLRVLAGTVDCQVTTA